MTLHECIETSRDELMSGWHDLTIQYVRIIWEEHINVQLISAIFCFLIWLVLAYLYADSVSASRLSRDCQPRLSGLPDMGHCAGYYLNILNESHNEHG